MSIRFRTLRLILATLLLCSIGSTDTIASTKVSDTTWSFVVSGDSRNCGDVVMPAIAAGARLHKATFYWHLGDVRAIYDFDQDYHQLHPDASGIEYLNTAWLDFQRSQIAAFGDIPFFLAIGNHETIPPKTREEFTTTFAGWLDTPTIRTQRLRDDAHDHQVRTYYHWLRDGVDFITLDNATPDQFDSAQLKWLQELLKRDSADGEIRAIVVGMHEALPESIARGHSMSDAAGTEAAGNAAYSLLLAAKATKPVYVLASHSHYFMEGIFNTPYWREHGGVLPGWIVGTAGAVRYPLPPDANEAKRAKTHVYGYLLASVSPKGTKPEDPIQFSFQELQESDTPSEVVQRFTSSFVHRCYAENAKQ